MQNNRASISVLTATFNAADVLQNLIESLRAQTDRDFEWIVMDGGSNDKTIEQLNGAFDILSHFESAPDFGIYHALNKAIQMSTGTYYLVLGADDSLYPTAIADFRKAALASNADIISAPVCANGIVLSPRRRIPWLTSSPPYVSCHSVGTLIRTDLHREVGPYSRRFPISADTYFILQAWKARKRFYCFDEPVGVFGTSGTSSNDTLGGLCESFRANVEVRGYLLIHLFLLVLRIIKNSRRIGKALILRRERG